MANLNNFLTARPRLGDAGAALPHPHHGAHALRTPAGEGWACGRGRGRGGGHAVPQAAREQDVDAAGATAGGAAAD